MPLRYDNAFFQFQLAVWPCQCNAGGILDISRITDLRLNGERVWPLVREKMEPKGTEEGRLSWELFDIYGAFPCVGDFHFSEFLPAWTRKGAYYGESIGMVEWGDSEKWVAYIDSQYEEMVRVSRGEVPVKEVGKIDDEQIIDVLDAYWRDKKQYFYTNLPNSGQAANLPLGAVLEGSTLIGASGFRPLAFGQIPAGIAAVLAHIIAVQELMVDAAIEGERKMVVQALVAAGHVHTLEEASALADALLNVQKEWLPRFFK
jgi:alpha-galactosidase